jgi:hypothetical protein
MMSKVNVWNTTGTILQQFDTVEEAEEWIAECEHEELHRTEKDGDTNIAVLEPF